MVSFEFISTRNLKRQYKVFGNFYNVEQEGKGNGYRNDLHIIDKDYFDVHGLTQPISY